MVEDEPAAADPERRELIDPFALFLNSLREGQRRRRRRHIPNVDGFKKLYNRDSKEDLSAARRFKCRVAVQQ